MTVRKLYHFETLLLALLLLMGTVAHAQAPAPTFKPQVTRDPWPQSSDPNAGVPNAGVAQPPLSPAQGAVAPGSTGPVILPVVPQNPAAAQKQQEENAALKGAFQQILNSMGGGANGRSEFGSPGYGGGDSYGHGYNGGGGKSVGTKDLTGNYKIVRPFQKWFDVCTKKYGDCKFKNWGIMGDASHRARRSCHNAGEAIDVGAITCSGGQNFDPTVKGNSAEEFFKIAQCMANDSNNELQVIFHRASGSNMMQKSDHAGHMHVQLKNCNMVGGQ